MFNVILLAVLGLVMVAAAIMAVLSEKMPTAILASGAISLLASIFFLVLASPDVAMTEAAIGAGLTTFLFFIILRKTEKSHEKRFQHTAQTVDEILGVFFIKIGHLVQHLVYFAGFLTDSYHLPHHRRKDSTGAQTGG